MTTIITKNGSGAPTAGQLSEGELAVDLTNKELYTKSGSTVIKIGSQGGSSGTFTDLTATSSFTSPGIDDNATSTALTIDANENVGIGMSPAGDKLQVDGNISASTGSVTAGFNVIAGGNISAAGSVTAGLDVQLNASGNTNPRLRYNGLTSSNYFAIRDDDAGVDRLKISNTGDATFSGNLTSTGIDDNANATAITIDSDENVGIGTDAPSAKLEVSGSATSNIIGAKTVNTSTGSAASSGFSAYGNSTAYSSLRTYGTGVNASAFGTVLANYSALITDGASSNGLIVGAITSDPVIFGTSNTERMRIDSSGNVGIGETNPNATLAFGDGSDVAFNTNLGATGTYGQIKAFNTLAPSNPATNIRFIRDVASVGNDGAICFDTVNTERMRIDSSGHAIIPAGVTLGTSAGVHNAANTLDDYEEGTWTPYVNANTTYVSRAGKYTKIGRFVFILGYVDISTIGTGQSQVISGLPFSASGENTISLSKMTNCAFSFYSAQLRISGTELYISAQTNFDGTIAVNQNFIQNGTEVQFSGCYAI